jgi:hypothetical protein
MPFGHNAGNIDLVKVQASPDKTRLYPLKIHRLDQIRRDRNVARRLRLRVEVISRIELVCCEQSAVAMRVVARLASVQLAFLSWLNTTGWTRDRGNLLWGEFFSHSRGTISQTLWRRRHASAQF